jgi:hypothetical protein
MKPKNVDFTIILNMSLVIENNKINVAVKNIDLNPAMVTFPMEESVEESRITYQDQKRKTLHEIIVETAKKLTEMGRETFSASDLYKQAIITYPAIKKPGFNANVISAAPEHNSWKHYPNRKKLLTYLGKGTYKLR